MKYICVEEQQVVSVLDYEPNVPATVHVHKVSASDYKKIEEGTMRFDAATGLLVPYDASQELQAQQASNQALAFLAASDWKVLRHIRERSLGIATTLTDEEYLELETQRQLASQQVRKG